MTTNPTFKKPSQIVSEVKATLKNLAIAAAFPLVLSATYCGHQTQDNNSTPITVKPSQVPRVEEVVSTDKYSDPDPAAIDTKEAEFVVMVRETSTASPAGEEYVYRHPDADHIEDGYDACNARAEEGYAMALLNDLEALKFVGASEGMKSGRKNIFSASFLLCPDAP